MKKPYTIEKASDVTVIEFSRPPTYAEAQEVIDTLAAENSYHLRLWDFTNILFDFTKEEIQAIARYGKTKFPDRNRIAVVAPQDLACGILRSFEVYREQDDHSLVRVFRRAAEAMRWLEEQKAELDCLPGA